MVKNAPPPQEQLTLRKENDKYVVINPTAYYITLVDAATKKTVWVSKLRACDGAAKEQLTSTGERGGDG